MKNYDFPGIAAIFSLPEGVLESSVLSESRTIPEDIARQLRACVLYRGYSVGLTSVNSQPSSHESPGNRAREIVVAGNPDSGFRSDVQALAEHFRLVLQIDAAIPDVKRWDTFADLSRNGKWAAATIAAPALRACGMES